MKNSNKIIKSITTIKSLRKTNIANNKKKKNSSWSNTKFERKRK